MALGFPSGLCPSGFPTKYCFAPLLCPISAMCYSHLILLDFINQITFGS
jgi:hypothetical protein